MTVEISIRQDKVFDLVLISTLANDLIQSRSLCCYWRRCSTVTGSISGQAHLRLAYVRAIPSQLKPTAGR